MKTQNPNTAFEFNGLTDWFEVFRSGTHKDSKGRENTFTNDDLDSIIANHANAEQAPLVVGHPKNNDPAFGWTEALKRDGDVLFAKAQNVVPEFETAVAAKQYRHRSVSLVPINNGYKLRHIGFLGAVAPAVPGLADIAFNDETTAIEFAVDDAVRSVGWRMGSIGRVLRNIKNYFIEQDGAESADRLIPEYTLDELNETSSSITDALSEPALNNHFSHKTTDPCVIEQTGNVDASHAKNEDTGMDYTQEQLDAAIAAATKPLIDQNDALKTAASEQAFNQRLTAAKTLVNAAVETSALLPADAAGMTEFLANLPQGEDAVFEFSQGEGDKAETKKVEPFEYMSAFIKSLKPQIELGRRSNAGDSLDQSPAHSFSAPSGATVDEDRAALDRKALEYSKANNVSYEDAVITLSREA